MNTPDEFRFMINMTVRNEWRNVDLLRTGVQNCFTAVFAHVDGCNAIAMVTGELVENALKYGDWEDGEQSNFRFQVEGDPNALVTVSVQNPVAKHDPNAEALHATIAWLSNFDTPETAYLTRLSEIATSQDKSMSRLGLARIAFEGKCKLAAKVSNGNVIVTATLNVADLA